MYVFLFLPPFRLNLTTSVSYAVLSMYTNKCNSKLLQKAVYHSFPKFYNFYTNILKNIFLKHIPSKKTHHNKSKTNSFQRRTIMRIGALRLTPHLLGLRYPFVENIAECAINLERQGHAPVGFL